MTLVICGTYTHASVSILKHVTETVIVLNVNPAEHEHGVIVIVSALMLFPSLNEWWESRNLTFNDHRDIKTAYMESPAKSEKKKHFHFSLKLRFKTLFSLSMVTLCPSPFETFGPVMLQNKMQSFLDCVLDWFRQSNKWTSHIHIKKKITQIHSMFLFCLCGGQ